MNHIPLNAQGASSLSVNAPEFVPGGGGGAPILVPAFHGGTNGPSDWQQQQQQSAMLAGAGQFGQPQFPPYGPYAPQQPIREAPTYAIQHQMAQMSINNRLRQFQNNPMPGNMRNGIPSSGGFGGGPPQHISNGGGRHGHRSGGGYHHSNRHNNSNHHKQHHGHPPAHQQAQQDGDFDDTHQPTETEDMALSFLNEVINKLDDNPGMFEQYQKRLKEVFIELTTNNFVMSNALEMLFKQSTKSQNFRYMGARICNLLDDLEVTEDSLFRNLLRMKMDFEKQELINFMGNEQYTVRGTTLFLAELYMQLRRPIDSYRNIEIAESIVFAVQLLLNRVTPENLKCVCQTLKLCGFELDLDCPQKMEEIICALEPQKNKFDTSTGRLIQSVLDLRAKHWGRSESFTSPDVNAPQDYNDGPVFYGPDGQVLTEEENSFLASNLPSQLIEDIVGEDIDSGEELVDDDDNAYDLEIQLAFKEFVNSNKNATNAAGGAPSQSNNSTSSSKQN